jgi:hypothetical protein
MSDILGWVVNAFRVVSHIVLLLLHNLIFIAVGVALLYGIFRLGRAGVGHLRGRGGSAQKTQPTPNDEARSSE